MRARAEQLEGWSAALPLAALSFLMPLTLWYLPIRFLTELSNGAITKSFDQFISISVVLTGLAHVALAVFSVRYGLRLQSRETEDLRSNGGASWIGALGVTVLGGAIPGAIFWFLPTMLIAITGIYFIPVMLSLMTRRIAIERDDLS